MVYAFLCMYILKRKKKHSLSLETEHCGSEQKSDDIGFEVWVEKEAGFAWVEKEARLEKREDVGIYKPYVGDNKEVSRSRRGST